MRDPKWLPIGTGKLALASLPGRKDLPRLPQLGCQHVVTLVAEHEGALVIGAAVQAMGLVWTWVPLRNGRYPNPEASARLKAALPRLSERLDAGEALLIHCSAGIHRTGMTAYALLRWRGLTADEALAAIARMRRFTRDGLQVPQLAWGEDVLSGKI